MELSQKKQNKTNLPPPPPEHFLSADLHTWSSCSLWDTHAHRHTHSVPLIIPLMHEWLRSGVENDSLRSEAGVELMLLRHLSFCVWVAFQEWRHKSGVAADFYVHRERVCDGALTLDNPKNVLPPKSRLFD